MDRPILLRAHEVRGVLDGRQTQLRRVVKGLQESHWEPVEPVLWDHDLDESYPLTSAEALGFCPFGVPGDRLWAKETWARLCDAETGGDERTYYAATHAEELTLADGDGGTALRRDGCTARSPWKSSTHMPRKYSRITLEVTGVRVERLQEISEADAKAEGADGERYLGQGFDHCAYREAYRTLWNEINGPGSWDANPWVWCVSFKLVEQ